MISELAYIDKGAKIGNDVTIEPFAYIAGDVVIGDGCVIKSHASILNGTRMGSNNKIYQGAVIGASPQDFRYKGGPTEVRMGNDNVIRENVIIARSSEEGGATVIGNHCHIMASAHLCHDVCLDDYVVVGLKSILAGRSHICTCSILSNAVILQQSVVVGKWSLIQSGARISKDVPPFIVVSGNPAEYHGVNSVILQNNDFHRVDDKTMRHIMTSYLIVYQTGISTEDAISRIKTQVPKSEEIEDIIRFLEHTKGII